jgi:hypothetical protein
MCENTDDGVPSIGLLWPAALVTSFNPSKLCSNAKRNLTGRLADELDISSESPTITGISFIQMVCRDSPQARR